MDIKPQDKVRKLYNLSLPVQLQVTFVAWDKNTCYIRLADEISISIVLIVQRALEELMVGDCLTVKKARWSNKNDIAVLEETPCPLIDSEFSHMIIVKYSVNSREIDNTSLLTQPIPYLEAIVKLRKSLHKKGYKQFGDYNALVKYASLCTEHADQNLITGTAVKQQGNKEFENKNFTEAVKFYEEAKKFLKYDVTIWSNSSLAYQRIGENEQSLVDALVALKLDPFSVKPYHRACYAMKNLKQFDLAVRFVRAGVFLCGSNADFNSIFDNIRSDISDVLNKTEFLRLQIKTVFAVGEQATLEANFMRNNMFSLADTIAAIETARSDHSNISPNQNDYGVPGRSLTDLLTEVCSTEKPNALLLPHPYAFTDFVEDLFVEKLPPGAKSIQRLIKDANSLFAQGSYSEAVFKYSEVCGANNPSICKSEIAVLKYLSTVCNVMLVHRNGFEDDFRSTLWFARMLQEWLFTHCMVIQPEPVKNNESRKVKKNCTQCIICKLNNKLSEDEAVELLLKTIPLNYLREVCAFKGGDLIQFGPMRRKPTSFPIPNTDKAHDQEFLEYMKYKAAMHYNRTMSACGDNASSTTENSNNMSDCAAGNIGKTRAQSSSVENVKGKNKIKQNANKKKAPAVKKNKNTKTNKKNKKKGKKGNTAQQKQGNIKRRNDDSDKDSDSGSSMDEMADDENEYENEYDMLSEDNISLSYNPRKNGEMNAGLDKVVDSPKLSDSQMEILYEFMADFMNSNGPMRVDDPRLANYMSEGFPENALSYVKSRSVEEFLVKSGKFIAIDSIICVLENIAAGKSFAASSILNSIKNSKFFLSDNCKSLRTNKKMKYSHFLGNNNSKGSSKPIPSKNPEKVIVNGHPIKKSKSSAMDLDDFSDDFLPSLPQISGMGINLGCDIVERSKPAQSSIHIPKSSNKSSKAVSQPDKNKSNKSSNETVMTDDLSFIRLPSNDRNNSDNLSMDTSNLRLTSDLQELSDELLKTRRELQTKTDEVTNTQKQYNELYIKLKNLSDEFNKFKLQQLFEMKQLEEDKVDLQKHIEKEKHNYVNGKLGDESMIKTLRKQMDVLTFKLDRSNTEINEKNKLVEQNSLVQNELMKRLKKADRAYLTLKNDFYEFICKRELNRLDSELKVLSSMPATALSPKIQSEATGLWQKVKLHISHMLQQEQKSLHASFDSINGEKYNAIEYSGMGGLNMPDAHLALLFEQQNLINGSVAHTPVTMPTVTGTPTQETDSPARSSFSATADIVSLAQPFVGATSSPFSTVSASAGLDTMSTLNRNVFDYEHKSASVRTPLYGDQSFAQQEQGQLRETIKEIWQNSYKATSTSARQFGVSPELPNPIVRPVPQLGTYHQTAHFNRSSPLDTAPNELYGKLVDGYIEKYGSTYSKEEISKVIVELKEIYRGRLSSKSPEAMYAIINELLTAKLNPWSSGSKMRQIWSTATDEGCPICLGSLSEGTKIELVCDHTFHKNCLATWSKKNSTCPTCRKVIVAANLI